MAGMGIGIMFYCQESLFHLHSNPYVGCVSGSPESIAYSLTLYDWTFNAWGLYAMLGLIIAYFHFNKGRELKISSIFPMRFSYVLRRAIDIVMALGIVAGLCTSLGLGVAQLCGGFKYVFHVDANPYILMMGICLIATWSVNSGLKRGVKWLSNSSTILVGILVLLVILFAYLTHSVTNYGSYIGKGLVTFFGNYIFIMIISIRNLMIGLLLGRFSIKCGMQLGQLSYLFSLQKYLKVEAFGNSFLVY